MILIHSMYFHYLSSERVVEQFLTIFLYLKKGHVLLLLFLLWATSFGRGRSAAFLRMQSEHAEKLTRGYISFFDFFIFKVFMGYLPKQIERLHVK